MTILPYPKIWHVLQLVGWLWLCQTTTSLSLRACEYTVRDIGFVDLGLERLSLSYLTEESVALSDEDEAQLRAWFMPWGIEFTQVYSSDTPASNRSPETSEARLLLKDSSGREFQLWSGPGTDQIVPLKSTIEQALYTPSMRMLEENALTSFAQVIVFESLEPEKVQDVLNDLGKAVDSLSTLLPRPIQLPTNIVRIPISDRGDEELLAWLIGAEKCSREDAAVAVVYGRGRLAGPCMIGDSLSFDELLAQFALVGQSCECQSQRKWYSQHSIPVRWSKETSSDAERALGFDANDPSVISEAKRIVGRDRLREGNWNALTDEVDNLVQAFGVSPGSSKPQATVIAGDGWGFDEESEPKLVTIPEGKSKSLESTQPNDEINLATEPQEPLMQSASGKDDSTPWIFGIVIVSGLTFVVVRLLVRGS